MNLFVCLCGPKMSISKLLKLICNQKIKKKKEENKNKEEEEENELIDWNIKEERGK